MKRILYLTRKFPPVKGGMEKLSYDLYSSLKNENADIDLVANRKGNKFLPFFLIKAAIKLINSRKYDAIHFGDVLLAMLIPIAKLFSKAKIVVTAHGLDVSYTNRLYQSLSVKKLKKADKIICISRYSLDECLKKGISREKCFVIPCGISIDDKSTKQLKKLDMEKKYNIILQNKKILFSVGRLVERKGNRWFIENVMPRLPDDYVYVVAGSGPEETLIKQAVSRLHLENRVFILGQIDDNEKDFFYKNSDLFIMPNIHVEGDVEGFGITLIEAASLGLASVAANVDAIPDTVINNITGYLVKEKDAYGFVKAILNNNLKKDSVRKATLQKFSWQNIAKEYLKAYE